MNILIVYGTLEGHTEKIADYMADIIRNKGHQVTTHLGKQLPANYSTEEFDAAIIGGSIHMGEYPVSVNKFILTHSSWLNTMPSAFFTVCLAVISKHEKSREEAKHYGKNFLAQIGWHPILNETFAGAVMYSKYNFAKRLIMQFIAKREGGSTDTSHDHEYTNWDEVTQFVEQFLIESEKCVKKKLVH